MSGGYWFPAWLRLAWRPRFAREMRATALAESGLVAAEGGVMRVDSSAVQGIGGSGGWVV